MPSSRDPVIDPSLRSRQRFRARQWIDEGNHTKVTGIMTTAPAIVRHANPLVRWLLRAGAPMGPNILLTVRGRRTGTPRTAPVAIAEIEGRLFVIGAYGDVNWVRNLRAAGHGQIRSRDRDVHVTAHELDRAAASTFYREAMPAFVGRLPLLGRLFVRVLFAVAGPEILSDPVRAAEAHPVFELRPVP
jgi:deazaflavin-dependent oxidoreductase (nitroreductase family)